MLLYRNRLEPLFRLYTIIYLNSHVEANLTQSTLISLILSDLKHSCVCYISYGMFMYLNQRLPVS